MNEMNMVWLAICVALVFFMQAGFAFLEAGAARAKNAVNVMMKNYMDMCLGVVVFWGIGYGLMYGESLGGWLGSNRFFPEHLKGGEAMHLAYQTMFAATAATIVSGAVAERMHFGAYLIFSALATAVIYPVFGGWAWNENGWLAKLGFFDFAGSTVVHSVGGWCSLAGITALGPRLGRYSRSGEIREIPGHNLPLVVLGAFILWLGWFGFNGGSIRSLQQDDLGLVLLNTHLGGGAGALGALAILAWQRRPILVSRTVNGSIAGLVSITAGVVNFTPLISLLVGAVGGMLYCLGVDALDKRRLDDAVGAVSVHGISGIWGTLAVALFQPGTFDWHVVVAQLCGIVSCFLWAFPIAFIFFKMLDKSISIRATTLHEQRGLDYTEHYEIAYPEFQRRLDDSNQ